MIDGLLSMVVRRIHGALDLGLALLLDSPLDRYPLFVAEHVAGPMRALSAVLLLAVREAAAEGASSPFEALVIDTEEFVGALADLGRWRALPAADVEDAAGRLGAAAGRLENTLRDIAERLCFEPALAREVSPEQHARYRRIVEQLPEDLAGERGSLEPTP